MAFNFNTFFGLEDLLNNKREIVIFWSFLGVLGLVLFLSFVSYIFRKLNINKYLIEALMWSLVFTFLIGMITILILFFLTDISGVKLIYIWFSIFIAYLGYALLHNNGLKKLFEDYSKTMIKK